MSFRAYFRNIFIFFSSFPSSSLFGLVWRHNVNKQNKKLFCRKIDSICGTCDRLSCSPPVQCTPGCGTGFRIRYQFPPVSSLLIRDSIFNLYIYIFFKIHHKRTENMSMSFHDFGVIQRRNYLSSAHRRRVPSEPKKWSNWCENFGRRNSSSGQFYLTSFFWIRNRNLADEKSEIPIFFIGK